jgi:ubiquinone/menaquinone biosynthesis C-methylase UbiE
VYAWFTAQAVWRASCARLASHLGDLAAPRVADLGCGPGVSTFELARYLPDARLVGMDVAPRMLREAQRRRRDAGLPSARISWLLADAERMPLEDASVDACTGHSFLYVVRNRAAVLTEVRRVLRPGGRLVLMEPNDRPASIGQMLSLSRDPRHVVSVSLWRPFSKLHGRFTAATLATTLERAGFVVRGAEETFGGLGVLAWAEAPG